MIMNDFRLSPHFTLSEFEKSATAEKYHIDNSVPPQYIPTLQQLCKEILEPLRRFVGGPIVISSASLLFGFRYDIIKPSI